MSFSTNKTPGTAKSGAQASVQSLSGSNSHLRPQGGLSLEEGSAPPPAQTAHRDSEARALLRLGRKPTAAGSTAKHKFGVPSKGTPPAAQIMPSANGHVPRPLANGTGSSCNSVSARNPFSSVMSNGTANRHNKRPYSSVLLDDEADNDIYAFRDSPPPRPTMRFSTKNDDKTKARTTKGDGTQIHAFRDLGTPPSNQRVPATNGDKAMISADKDDGPRISVSREGPPPPPNMVVPVITHTDKDHGTHISASLDAPPGQSNMRSPVKGANKAQVRPGEDGGTPKRTPKGKSRQPHSARRRRHVDDSDSDGVAAALEEFTRGDPEAEELHMDETPSRQPVPGPRPHKDVSRRAVVGAGEGAVARLTEKQFDSIIYGQEDAASPPPGVVVPRAASGKGQPAGGMLSATGHQHLLSSRLHLHIDPRVHWTHDRGEEWRREKMEDISGRGTRKTNFGKAAARMAARRREEATVRRATPVKRHRNDAGVRKFGRPVDFADVPEDELPDMVKKNEAWLRAIAYMRGCRERELAKLREAERPRKTGPSTRTRPAGASGS